MSGEARGSLSRDIQALYRGDFPSAGELEHRYGATLQDTAAQTTASTEMRSERFATAAAIAYEALQALEGNIIVPSSFAKYSPDDTVDILSIYDISMCIFGVSTQFRSQLRSIRDPGEHPELAHITTPHAWMSQFESMRFGFEDEDTLLERAVSSPFEFMVRELLTHVIPQKWEEKFPNIPLTFKTLFQIAFARPTGHILSKLAALHMKDFVPIFAGLQEEPEASQKLNPNFFELDVENLSLRLKEETLAEIEEIGRERLVQEESETGEQIFALLPDGPTLGCIMNAPERAFDSNAPAQTLMMMYYHMLLANVQKGLYHKE